MENGVQNVDKSISEEETKTADGGVSQLKLGDNVVQVFPELKDSEGDDVGVSSVETKLADGGVSQLKLGENVVQVFPEVKDFEDDDVEMMTPDAGATPLLSKNVFHVFHEAKDIEGDDVFEEAMMDVHPDEHTEKVESKEAVANGDENVEKIADADRSEVRSSNEAQDGEKVKEAVEVDVPSEEAKTPVAVEGKLEALEGERPVDEVRVADEVVHDGDENVEQIGNLDSLAVNGATNEVFKADKVGDENAEQVGTTDSLAVNGGNKEVLEGDKVGEAGESSLPNEDQSSQIEQPIRVKEELKTSVDADPADMVRVADVVVDENLSKKVLAEEAPERVFVEGDVDGHSIGVVDGKKVSSGNGELESGVSCDAAVNVNSENGDLDKLKLEQKSNVPPKSSEVDQVSPDEIKLSEGNESNDQIFCQEDQSSEMRDIGTNMDTSLNKDMESQEIESVVRNLDGPVDKETEGREIKSLSSVERLGTAPDERVEAELIELEAKDDQNHQPDERVEAESIELEAKDDQNHQAHHISESIEDVSSKHVLADKPEVREIQNDLSDNHVVSEEPEVQEIQDDRKEQVSPSIEELKKLKSAREPEIQPAVEPAQPPPPPRPAGLGGAAPLLDPAPRAVQQSRVNGAIPQRQAQLVEDSGNGEAEENDETREKLQMIRVKFLRLAHRLGQTPHNVVVAQVLYRLGLAEQLRGRNASRAGAFSFDRASAMAEQIEAAGQEPLDFSCTIMVLGKTGVGKSATINSIFDEVKFSTDAFQMGTRKVQDVVGTVQGIKVRVIDTPGLLPCWSDQKQNEKILHSVKRFIKKNPPDIVLYLDRLDMQSRDFGDLPLLRTITEIFGPSIWFNAIVVLTHAASAPPDGPNGIASSYEMFVTQRSHVVQQAIRQAAGDMRLMNPVSLVENHSACRTNRAGQRVLPNGQVWKPHLLLLSFASKILAEANTLLKLQDNPPGKPFATRSRVPPLPFLLSSLLQSRPQLKLPEEQLGGEDDLDEDLDESSDSDGDSDYDDLPPFKALTKAQLAKLSKAQKKAYFDELEYREKLFMKKQLRDEKRRRKLLKKMAASAKDLPNDYNESAEEDSGGAASVPVAMPDFTLPASFDSDNPTHRYRFLDTSNQWLVRPVLETHGWDHDVGYEGINVERLFVVKDKVPLSFSGQVTKDKKESNLQMEVASSIKHNEGKATSVGFDMQTVGKDMAYTLRSETRFSNFRHNKAAAGLSVTLLGDALTAGVKVEDRLIVNKRFRVVLTGGAMTGRGEVAYGGSLEATLRDKDYPLGRALSTLALSIMDWHGDLALGCNVQSQIPIGRTTNVITRANLNNRGSGQVSIRLNSAEQLQVALIGLLPLFKKIAGHYQQMLYGE